MNPLPTLHLKETEPSKFERFFERIPIFGTAVAWAFQDRRFRPIERAYTELLRARDHDDTIAQWPEDLRADAIHLMTILEQELGWKPAHFVPDDPCLVAFWAHQDGLDDVCAIQSIETAWGIDLSAAALDGLYDISLLELLHLVKSQSQQGGAANRDNAGDCSQDL